MSMIKVTAGTTTSTKTKVVDDGTIIANFLADNNISTTGCTVTLDSEKVADLNVSFADAGAKEECFLFSVVNTKNA